MPNAADLAGLQLLANILSLPAEAEAQQQQQGLTRRALQTFGGLTPEEVDQLAPPPPEPNGLQKFFRPMGTIGAGLRSILGQPVAAPRIDLGELGNLSNLAKSRREAGALEGLTAGMKSDTSRNLARLGKVDEALKVEGVLPGRLPSNELALLIQLGLDQGMAEPDARKWAAEQYNQRLVGRAGAQAGARAAATVAQTTAGKAGQLPGARQRLEGILNEAPSLLAPQAATPGSRGPLTLLADIQSEPAAAAPQKLGGLEPRSATLDVGGGSVQFGRPEKVHRTLDDVLGESLGIDLKNPQLSDQDAERFIRAKSAYETARKEADIMARPLPQEQAKEVVGRKVIIDQLDALMRDFTPEERNRFVSIYSQPLVAMQQYVQPDPRYQEWQARLGIIQMAKFDRGGLNLTKQESDIIDLFLPGMREVGGVTQFDAKVHTFINDSRRRLQTILQVGSTPRSRLAETLGVPTSELDDWHQWLQRKGLAPTGP